MVTWVFLASFFSPQLAYGAFSDHTLELARRLCESRADTSSGEVALDDFRDDFTQRWLEQTKISGKKSADALIPDEHPLVPDRARRSDGLLGLLAGIGDFYWQVGLMPLKQTALAGANYSAVFNAETLTDETLRLIARIELLTQEAYELGSGCQKGRCTDDEARGILSKLKEIVPSEYWEFSQRAFEVAEKDQRLDGAHQVDWDRRRADQVFGNPLSYVEYLVDETSHTLLAYAQNDEHVLHHLIASLARQVYGQPENAQAVRAIGDEAFFGKGDF